MKGSENPFPSVNMEEILSDGSTLANADADFRRLFLGEDGALHLKDSAGAVTAAAGLADEGAFTYLDATEAAAPGTPASGYARIYAKTDGRIYSKDDAGVEYGPFDAAGGAGGPLMVIDDVALHADGDEFDDDTLAAWTSVGVTATAVTTELYDDTCLDLAFSAANKYIWKAITVSDNIEISLTIHGFDRSDNHYQTASGHAMGLFFSNDAGTGICCFPYFDNGVYLWGLTSYGLGSGAVVVTTPWALIIASARTANAVFVVKLKKVGSTITGSWSDDGGATWKTNTTTDSTSLTRMGIIGAYNNTIPDPVLRVGRFNVEEL